MTRASTPVAQAASLEAALRSIAASAGALDADPAFPREALESLDAGGALAAALPAHGGGRPPFAAELWAVRRTARADGSVGRVVDGHLNAVERIDVACPEPLRGNLLDRVARGGTWLGVWGADPPGVSDEAPASLERRSETLRLTGTKDFCSGAGGLHGALVVARDGEQRVLAYVELGEGVEVDRSWFRAAGMRASESHRVRFDGARVAALLGGPGELLRQPWFARDAIRTAATWAGLADRAQEAAHAALAPRVRAGDELAALALGRIATHATTIDLWLERGADAGDEAVRAVAPDGPRSLGDLSIHLRDGVASAASALVDEALRAAGSRPLVEGGALDRTARDLRVFLLQHRLDPLLARSGRTLAGA